MKGFLSGGGYENPWGYKPRLHFSKMSEGFSGKDGYDCNTELFLKERFGLFI